MIKIKYICDKCGLEEETNTQALPKEWNSIEYTISYFDGKRNYIENSLCPKCSKELGIIRDNRQCEVTHYKSIGDRLVEILTEIVQGETNE